LNELALFAGAGGGILGGKLLGWKTVCAVEWDGYARDVLVSRQNDGTLDPFPIWDDVCTFDGKAWRGRVDVVSGGFPCQDISVAGNGAGLAGERSGLWAQQARLIGELRPRYALVENVAALLGRGLDAVLGDLATLGYDAEWHCIPASAVGAPHRRDRAWVVAYPECQQRVCTVLDANDGAQGTWIGAVAPRNEDGVRPEMGTTVRSVPGQWLDKPHPERVVNGVSDWPHRLRALGNAVVPQIPELIGHAILQAEQAEAA